MNNITPQQNKECPFCGETILAKAIKCKHCGEFLNGRTTQLSVQKHTGKKCPYCGEYGVGKVRGLQGAGEIFIAVILFFCFLIPGIIYYICQESVPYCLSCGRRIYK